MSAPNINGLLKSILIDGSKNKVKVSVQGHSMSPFIRNNSIVIIKPLMDINEIHFGDIVAFQFDNQPNIIIHRAIGREKKKVLLKGDNSLVNDGWFSIDSIFGVVVAIHGPGINKKNYKWINVAIALISKTGLLNKILLPVMRSIKKNILHG